MTLEGRRLVAPDLELLAQGRDADVYALDDATVLRRYRDPTHSNTLMEAKVMAYLAEHGYPVPRVHNATDTDLVLERLNGPTLFEALEAQPDSLARNARQLAELHDRLAAVPAPDWLPAPRDGHGRAAAGTRASVLHLDLHPLNVILTPERGPMVIDWTIAAAGDPAFDLARTIVTISTADLPEAQTALLRRYTRILRHASTSDPSPHLADAARAKLAEPNKTESEAARLRALIESAEGAEDVKHADRAERAERKRPEL